LAQPALAVLLCVLAVGCRTAAVAEKVEVTWFFPQRLANTNGELALELAFAGYTDQTRVSAVSFDLWIGGHWFAAGTQTLDAPAKDTVLVAFPLAFRRAAAKAGSNVAVEVRGVVSLAVNGDVRTTPFEARAQLAAESLPAVPTAQDDP
jgi:hypothetical protein